MTQGIIPFLCLIIDLKNSSWVLRSEPTKLKGPRKFLEIAWLVNPTISSTWTQGK